jgi:4-hydroxyproline epimerase
MAEKRDDFRNRFDYLRAGIINEPRGSEVVVGAYLTEPVNPDSDAGVIFFNNAGYLGMCGHGTIGVVVTLAELGDSHGSVVRLDTPAGTVEAHRMPSGTVRITNVPSFRFLKDVKIMLDDGSSYVGDVAYGGNWFYIVNEPKFALHLKDAKLLTALTGRIMSQLADSKVTGADGALIDHVELYGSSEIADAKNFVLCPGGAYDRSPCGTGTSAKLACLYADGKLKEGEEYRIESITGSTFAGSVKATDVAVIPTIEGSAFITAYSTLVFDDRDPIQWGLGT